MCAIRIDWKVRLRNKAFWVALFSLISLVARKFGFLHVAEDWGEIVDAVLSLLVLLGIIVDPTTPGIFDAEKSSGN